MAALDALIDLGTRPPGTAAGAAGPRKARSFPKNAHPKALEALVEFGRPHWGFDAGDRNRSFAGADHPRLPHQVVEAFFIICPDISIFETVMVSPSRTPVSFTEWPACSSSPAASWFAILSTFPL